MLPKVNVTHGMVSGTHSNGEHFNFTYSQVVLGLDCHSPDLIMTDGLWLGDNPLTYALPLFLIQLLIISFATRPLALLLRHFHQPTVIAEILVGLILGPTVMGRSLLMKRYMRLLFPPRSFHLLYAGFKIGLVYLSFTMGLEMDMSTVTHTSRKVLCFAASGLIFPILVAAAAARALSPYIFKSSDALGRAMYLHLAGLVSMPSFFTLSRILLENKFMSTEIGRIALSTVVLLDVSSWTFFAVAISLTHIDDFSDLIPPPPSHLMLLATALFILFFVFAVRPAVARLISRIPEGEPMSDMYGGTILVGAMATAVVSDAIGLHAAFGAFMFGFVMPTGAHVSALLGRFREFNMDLFVPLCFVVIGFQSDILTTSHPIHILTISFVFLISTAVKLGTTVLIASGFGFPLAEGITLGFLVNARGFITLSIARDKNLIEEDTYATILVLNLLMTLAVTPVATMAYRRSRKHPVYDGRDLQLSRYSDAELRVLACVHSQRNVPPLLSLLDLLNPTKKSPISVCALRLIQLTSHVTGPDSDHITATLHSYEQHAAGISFELVTAISPFSTMHEDVCSAAEDRRAALIVLPFHRAHAVDGGMEALHPSIRAVNAHALKHAPCSVAVLVDRGLCGLDGRHVQPSLRVAVLFFGGADDREALACAWRMAGHPSVALTAIRFFTEGERLGGADEVCISEYRIKFVNEERVDYVERVVGNSEEAVAAIRGMGWERQDLYVVGRGGGCGSRLTDGMEEWADCPELGPIGDLLASLDYEAGGASVLVVQQYVADDIRDSNCRRSASSTGAI